MDASIGSVHVDAHRVRDGGLGRDLSEELNEKVERAAAEARAATNAVDEFLLNEELAERKIACAIEEENYKVAKSIKEERARKERELSPSAALAAALARRLREPNGEETVVICEDVVQLGDRRVVPSLLRALCTVDDANEDAAKAIEQALWSLWQRSGDTAVDNRLNEGINAMGVVPDGLPVARDIFTEIIIAKPEFAEAHNKRATANYLMQLYNESIKDCVNTLKLNPFHFGAHSGKGLCHLALHQYEDALRCFEDALRVNPRMEHVQRYRSSLTAMLERQGQSNAE